MSHSLAGPKRWTSQGGTVLANPRTRFVSSFAIAFLACVDAQTCAIAKTDIRGVSTGASMEDAVVYLGLDGANCTSEKLGDPVRCAYDAGSVMTLYGTTTEPSRVIRIVYDFTFTDLGKVRARLANLYGLQIEQVEGEHALENGVRLNVRLTGDAGSIDLSEPLNPIGDVSSPDRRIPRSNP